VQDAIKGLQEGTLDPTKEIKIEGIETEEERVSKAEELARKKEEYLVTHGELITSYIFTIACTF
jgi:aspartokinase